MTFFAKLFSKKVAIKAQCPITKDFIEEGYGYMLTTSEAISSKVFWDKIMTEPETLSYTKAHFNNDTTGTHMRGLIFEKYSGIEKPWMISDECITFFEDIDRQQARSRARNWWESAGTFVPENAGSALDVLDATTFQQLKEYAVLEAGRNQLARAENLKRFDRS
jgi:hypothetical protein